VLKEPLVSESAGTTTKHAAVVCTHIIDKVLDDGLHGSLAPRIILNMFLQKIVRWLFDGQSRKPA
jgi:hypothetical protein